MTAATTTITRTPADGMSKLCYTRRTCGGRREYGKSWCGSQLRIRNEFGVKGGGGEDARECGRWKVECVEWNMEVARIGGEKRDGGGGREAQRGGQYVLGESRALESESESDEGEQYRDMEGQSERRYRYSEGHPTTRVAAEARACVRSKYWEDAIREGASEQAGRR